MKDVSILDCTLRDGGYLVEGLFGDVVIRGIIDSLTQSGIEIIEVGFLKNDPHTEGSTVFNNAEQIKNYLPANKGNSEYVCLADFSRYNINALEACDGDSITGVRACFFKKENQAVIPFCKTIKEKGYKLFVQPVDILGYTDEELLKLIAWVNDVKPYAFSIVDTFGSMYSEDLLRVVSLVHHNLSSEIAMGFHSHNNMQMSFALTQEFVKYMHYKRKIFIDGTLAGMGRGAGNANTELLMNYLIRFNNAEYNLNLILDAIDNYILGYKNKHEWGYSIPLFLAGIHSSHVNNISYLLKKAGIESKDINNILDGLDASQRKRYDYDELERVYQKYMHMEIDDVCAIEQIGNLLHKKVILIMLPGFSVVQYEKQICHFYETKKPIVISVNFINDYFDEQILYFNNLNRYKFWEKHTSFDRYKRIVTTNIDVENSEEQISVDYSRLLLNGEGGTTDNSAILLLRLLDLVDVEKIYIAGFDGFDDNPAEKKYVIGAMEKPRNNESADDINEEIEKNLSSFFENRKGTCNIQLLTPSRFGRVFEKHNNYE